MLEIFRWNEHHIVYSCKIADLLQLPIENWTYNRPPDLDRCAEIAETFSQKDAVMDGMLSMVKHTKYNETKYLMVDGIHRYKALSLLWEKYTQTKPVIPSFSLLPLEKEENNIQISIHENLPSIMQTSVLVCIRTQLTNGQIIDWFQTINKSLPVPELYINQRTPQEKKKVIETLVAQWKQKYKSHFMTTRHPNMPNTNVELFTVFLEKIYNKYYHSNTEREMEFIMSNKLFDLNQMMSSKEFKRVSPKIMEKCRSTGCFLFLTKLEEYDMYI